MQKVRISALLIMFSGFLFAANIQDGLQKTDSLYDNEQYSASFSQAEKLLSSAISNKDKAELYWRMSRSQLQMISDKERAGADKELVIAGYTKGEQLADKAVALDSSLAEAFYWKSSNIGKAGSAKGILKSLMMAKPMKENLEKSLMRDPEYADAYFVMAQLYYKVPGKPLSFGNADRGVNLARKSIVLMEMSIKNGKMSRRIYSYELELASALLERDWKSSKRNKEQSKKKKGIKKAKSTLERDFYYESSVKLKKMSDEEEALKILNDLVKKIKGLKKPFKGDLTVLEDARKILAGN